jgi:hypothetical protein
MHQRLRACRFINPLRAGGVVFVVIASVVVGPVSRSESRSVPNRRSTITGYVRLCGGPAPGRCFVATFGVCQAPVGCVTTDRVAVLDADGRQVAAQRLHHARFHVRVRPGRYTVELIGDGRRVHRQVMQRRHVSVRPGGQAVARFFFAVA